VPTATPFALVDAFTTSRAFSGNPAGVVMLDELVDNAWMQGVANELAQAETAFLAPSGDGAFRLRWFTPVAEVALCGHATLAAAHHLVADLGVDAPTLRFITLSGVLTASITSDGWIELDFPADPPVEATPPPTLIEALGDPEIVSAALGRGNWLIETTALEVVRDLRPDHRALLELRESDVPLGVIVTAVGEGLYDFVSRYFAPAAGIDEDAVTGSAHTTLGPFWAERLGKTEFLAKQISTRGGVIRVDVRGDRVLLGGQAVTVFRGELGGDVLAERMARRL
jgi:PhzF family phenazine biosynthesis protein